MPKSNQQKQRSVEKHRKKQQARQHAARSQHSSSTRAAFRAASSWQVKECLITAGWRAGTGELAELMVARQSPLGRIAVGMFMIDLGCLGVKDAFGRGFDTEMEYRSTMDAMIGRRGVEAIDLNQAACILRESIEYARNLGFDPHPDYADTSLIIAGADPEAASEHVAFGRNGRPFYCSGPDDDVPRILAKLSETTGEGNFDFVAGIG